MEKLLYLLPQCREGVGLIAHGLFAEDENVQKLAAKILMKIKQGGRAGQLAFGGLSEFMRYQLVGINNLI